MPLARTIDVINEARGRGAAAGAFEPYTVEQIQATVLAAQDEGRGIILQLWSEVLETWGFALLTSLISNLAADVDVPVAIHLDHALEEDLVWTALDNGFTGVMFDGSKLPYEENVQRTRVVVDRARGYGAAVEAELGIINFMADYATPEEARAAVATMLTSPEQAQDFVERTGIDVLAPAIGSIHGCPLPAADLDIPRIAAIAEITGLPLALHGGSGVKEEDLAAAIHAGICKVNVDAEVRGRYIRSLKGVVGAIGTTDAPDHVVLARYPRVVRDEIRSAVRRRIGLLQVATANDLG